MYLDALNLGRTKTSPLVKSSSKETGESQFPSSTETLTRNSTLTPATTAAAVSTSATDGEKAIRLALYKRDGVRRFVEWLLKQTVDIVPQVDSTTGEHIYADIPESTGNLLPELESVGILEKYLLDKVPSCPQCETSNFSVAYVCPYCQAHDIERGMTVEHYACGHIDLESNFKRGFQLICPKCSRPLKLIGTDYRKIGTDYHCNSCNKFFDIPLIEFSCRKCRKNSKPEEVTLNPLYAYKLNANLRGELVAHCTLETQFTDVLKKSGFEITAPMVVTGLSGIEHTFDLHAWREGADIMLDFVSAGSEIGPEEIAAFFAKIYDTKPRRAILVAMPKLSQAAQKLSAMYNVEIIAAEIVAELIEKLSLLVNLPESVSAQRAERAVTSRTSRMRSPVSAHETDRTVSMAREVTARIMSQMKSEQEKVAPEPSQGSDSSPVADLRRARTEMERLLSKEIP